MPLLEKLPHALEDQLRIDGTLGSATVIAATDLLAEGAFGREWLVVTANDVRVYSETAQSQAPRILMLLSDAVGVSVDALVAGGALLATTRGSTIELLRFTNAQQAKFARVAKFLQDTIDYRRDCAEGKPVKDPPVIAEDPDPPRRCPKCNLLLGEGTSVCPACVDKGRTLLRILGYLRPYWKKTLLVWTLMLLGMAVSLVPPYLTRPLMDRVLTPQEPVRPWSERLVLLGWLVLGLLASQLASQVIGVLRGRSVVSLASRLSHDMRMQVYSHLQFLSLRFFEKKPTGAMIARVTQDTDSLEAVLVDGAQFFVVNILTLLGIGGVLMALNWRLTILVLLPVPVVIALSHVFWRRILTLWHRYWHYRSHLVATVNDSLSGLRVVKAFAKESQEIQRFGGSSRELYTASLVADQTWATLFPMLWFVVSIGGLLVWYFGGRRVVGGHMTIGTLMTFVSYLGMFYGPLQFLSRIADWLGRSLTAAERVFEVLDTSPETRDERNAVALPSVEGRIEFDHVTFGYQSHKPVLKDVCLDVRPGEMIGLVGKSGAGKSTTVNLICRFYDVNEGQIRVDGVNLKQVRHHDLRSQIGVVLQDTFLFNGTIAQNIGYARPEATPEEIMAAAKAANAHDFIVGKPDGYDTVVGERGQSLSGGERQRIAIARAILHNPRILILDEATSSVDSDTEKQIQDAIAWLVKGRTTFAIAHRLSTLRNANRLVVLKEGRVEEVGTHEELMAKKGEFARLAEMQRSMSAIIGVGT